MRLRLWMSVLLATPLLCLAVTTPQPKNLVMTLPQAVAYALRNNSTIQSAYLERELSTFSLEITKAGYQIQPTLSFNQINTQVPNAFSRPTDRQFGVTPGLTWNTPYSTQFNFQWQKAWVNGQNQDAETLSVMQPLLQGFGKSIAEIPLKNAEDQDLLAQYSLRNSIISTVTQVITDFYALQGAQMSLAATQTTLQQNQLQLNQDKIRVKAGELAPSELIQDKAQQEQAAVGVGSAQIALRNARLALLTDLGLEPTINLQIKADDTLPKSKPDVKQCEVLALQNNINYQNDLINLKMAKRGLLQATDQARWQLDLTATSTRTGTTPPAAPTGQTAPLLQNGVGDALGAATTDNQVGLNLQIPIGIQHLESQSSIAQAKLGIRSAELQLEQDRIMILNQVDTQVATLQMTLDNVHLAEDALLEQKKTVHVTEQQVTYGIASNFELFQQRSLYFGAQQNLISNKMQYLANVAAFDAFLGTTLQTWNINVKDPTNEKS